MMLMFEHRNLVIEHVHVPSSTMLFAYALEKGHPTFL